MTKHPIHDLVLGSRVLSQQIPKPLSTLPLQHDINKEKVMCKKVNPAMPDLFNGLPSFINDLEKNYAALLAHLNLHDEHNILKKITAFQITVNGQKQELQVVNGGRFKTAVFLLGLQYYKIWEGASEEDTLHFIVDNKMKKIAIAYFGDSLYYEVTRNPQTKHKNLRHLLTPGEIWVTIYPEAGKRDNLYYLR